MPILTAVLMLILALFLTLSEWEKVQLVKKEYRVETSKCGRKTFVFISDLHDYLPARHTPEKILDMIDSASPDAVLIGGDMITVSRKMKPGGVADTAATIRLIKMIAEKYPVYYGEGNHESRYLEKNSSAYAEYVAELLKAGVKYLADLSEDFDDVGISAVTLPDECFEPMLFKQKEKIKLPENFLREKLGENDGKKFSILLMHSPRYLKEASGYGADLVLSGHMHGGTVRLPDGSGLMTPQYQFFVKECSGEFTDGKTKMIVNRGLGTHSVKVRINDLPEISVIYVEGNDKLQA